MLTAPELNTDEAATCTIHAHEVRTSGGAGTQQRLGDRVVAEQLRVRQLLPWHGCAQTAHHLAFASRHGTLIPIVFKQFARYSSCSTSSRILVHIAPKCTLASSSPCSRCLGNYYAQTVYPVDFESCSHARPHLGRFDWRDQCPTAVTAGA